MRTILFFSAFFCFLFIFCFSCGSSQKTAPQISPSPTAVTPQTKEEKNSKITLKKKEIIIDKRFIFNEKSVDFSILSTSIDENILTIVVLYSGGCQPHQFDLITPLMYAKSIPPQLNLYLTHQNNGDACREQIKENLFFDLSNIQYKGEKSISLTLNLTNKFIYQY